VNDLRVASYLPHRIFRTDDHQLRGMMTSLHSLNDEHAVHGMLTIIWSVSADCKQVYERVTTSWCCQ
jgi:hypothetical protein